MFIAAPQTFFQPGSTSNGGVEKILEQHSIYIFPEEFFFSPSKEVDWYSAEIKTTTNGEERISTLVLFVRLFALSQWPRALFMFFLSFNKYFSGNAWREMKNRYFCHPSWAREKERVEARFAFLEKNFVKDDIKKSLPCFAFRKSR